MFDATDGGPAVWVRANGNVLIQWPQTPFRLVDEYQAGCSVYRHEMVPADAVRLVRASSNGLTVNPRLVESFVADGVRWIREADDSPSLPEPDVNNPEQCRFVSEVSRRLEPEVADGYADWERGLTAREWGQRADRLEREQAAKTAQDHAIEQAAQVMYEGYNRGSDWAKASAASHDLYRRYARDLADAGLLNTKHGDGSGSEPKCGEA